MIAALACAASVAGTAPAAQFTQPVQPLSAQPNLRADQLRIGPSMEGLSAAAVRLEVRNSPLFLAELDHGRLIAGGPVAVTLQAGVELDLNAYLSGSRLMARPSFAALQSEPEALGIIGPVQVREKVYLMEDRIVVSREAVVRVSARTCLEDASPQGPARQRGFLRQLTAAARQSVERARAELCLAPPQPGGVLQGAPTAPVLLDPAAALTPSLSRRVQSLDAGQRLLAPPTQADTAEAAEEVRRELRAMNCQSEFRHGVTVAQALALPDDELLRLDMDGEERIISHISIIPLAPRANVSISGAPDLMAPPAPPADFGRGFSLDRSIGPRLQAMPPGLTPFVMSRADLMPSPRVRNVPPGALTMRPAQTQGEPGLTLATPQLGTLGPVRGLMTLPGAEPERREPIRRTTVSQRADHYFVTGFTLSDQIEERYKHTFNRRRNYFVAFQYSVGYRAGLRFPFHVSTQSDTSFRQDPRTGRWSATDSTVRISAAGRQTTVNGGSIYQASGMARELWFDDREFTIGVWAGCQLQVRGPIVGTVRINCPSVSVPRAGTCPNWACADFDPPIGRRTLLAQPRLPASVTGLQVNAWVGRAGVEPGVNVYAANARFLLDAEARGSRFVTSANDPFPCRSANRSDPSFDNQLVNDRLCRLAITRSPMENREMVLRLVSQDEAAPGVILRNPAYEFTLEFVPVLGLFAVIDIAVASWRFDTDIEIRGLTLRQEFRFNRHAGTTERAEIGMCGPLDRNAPGCSARLGYSFGRIWEDDGGPG